MAHTIWTVAYPGDPSASPAAFGGKVIGTLEGALADHPVDAWDYEVDGKLVRGHENFRARLAEATTIFPGQFVARAGGIVVQSVGTELRSAG
ncbi:hypothetical protein [Streptomyces sp. NPDC005435]|uniref:hypothetical protein n=1 Tax=Streptomyces sp. NPDC005435 TaxID=3154464 RepID=UPI003451CA68